MELSGTPRGFHPKWLSVRQHRTFVLAARVQESLTGRPEFRQNSVQPSPSARKQESQMTTLIQRDDASIEPTSTEANVEDWIGGLTPAPLDLPVASHEQPRPTPR